MEVTVTGVRDSAVASGAVDASFWWQLMKIIQEKNKKGNLLKKFFIVIILLFFHLLFQIPIVQLMYHKIFGNLILNNQVF